jgi:type I restriction enzyme M protein
MPLTSADREWYYNQIEQVDPHNRVVKVDRSAGIVSYSSALRSDESGQRDATPEELVHALAICVLVKDYDYRLEKLYHEKYFAHGSKGSLSDEVDLIIYDEDDPPYAMWEFKSADDFEASEDRAIRHQLFGTAPLAGDPRLLVYATVHPSGTEPNLQLRVIDHSSYPSYESWLEHEKPSAKAFPKNYQDPDYEPFKNGGSSDLRLDCTQADFRAAAATFHNEFFGEHPDNVLYVSLVKCLLAKILDERNTRRGEPYRFQIFYRNGKPETAAEVFDRVNTLYSTAYQRYIDASSETLDEIDTREFSPERVKTVVRVLQGMSITRGAALHGDVIGAFFEQILRNGFKQDKGMYFTHDNLVNFMLHAVDLRGLTTTVWESATHPENRLPYVIDPACGSGTFLLRAMRVISETVETQQEELVTDLESESFFRTKMSDPMPNTWAESFLYGFDPKFVMAITAKVNMVLHGDGSAHIFKYDAFSQLSSYSDARLRPVGDDSLRSIPRARYNPDVCEPFDLVSLSKPPSLGKARVWLKS